jgi:hypothetical protein
MRSLVCRVHVSDNGVLGSHGSIIAVLGLSSFFLDALSSCKYGGTDVGGTREVRVRRDVRQQATVLTAEARKNAPIARLFYQNTTNPFRSHT